MQRDRDGRVKTSAVRVQEDVFRSVMGDAEDRSWHHPVGTGGRFGF
jgi:hypothetical protein